MSWFPWSDAGGAEAVPGAAPRAAIGPLFEPCHRSHVTATSTSQQSPQFFSAGLISCRGLDWCFYRSSAPMECGLIGAIGGRWWLKVVSEWWAVVDSGFCLC
jgi:hypothetical protein